MSASAALMLRADVITSWGDGDLGTDFSINQGAGEITILKGEANTYKFYSETVQFNGIPGVINNITVDPNASGDFSLLIDHPDAGKAGAENFREGDLTYSVGTSTIIGLDIAGDVMVNVSGDTVNHIICEEIDGARAENGTGPGQQTGQVQLLTISPIPPCSVHAQDRAIIPGSLRVSRAQRVTWTCPGFAPRAPRPAPAC